jgi:hypothetical protein
VIFDTPTSSSFLSKSINMSNTFAACIFKKVGNVVESLGALGVFGPYGAVASSIFKVITTAETNHPTDGQGNLKATEFNANFDADLQATTDIITATGHKLTYDTAKRDKARNDTVTAFNSIHDFQQSFKIEKI